MLIPATKEDRSSYAESTLFVILIGADVEQSPEHHRPRKLKNQETVVEGIDQAVGAFRGLFQGQNVGRMVMKLI